MAEILAMTERLVRQGWSRRSAAEAAEYAVRARSGGGRGEPLEVWRRAATGPEVRVPQVEQVTNYTCGPAALRAALAALGVPATEDDLAARAGTTASGGTNAEGLAAAAEHHGIAATIFEGTTVDDVVQGLDEGAVLLACIQALGDEDRDSSHWVVPVAVKDDGAGVVVLLMDPGVPEAHSTLTLDEFEERWTCLNNGEPVNGLAVVLRGAEPARIALALPQAAMG